MGRIKEKTIIRIVIRTIIAILFILAMWFWVVVLTLVSTIKQ